jgi:hypothetical protein
MTDPTSRGGGCTPKKLSHWEGAQWELCAVGNAEWIRVPLGVCWGRTGIGEDACEIVLDAADQGSRPQSLNL